MAVDHGSVIAPAGCGKTELIARAVAEHGRGSDLILTHTNAGVAALAARLAERGASTAGCDVSTIAGWCLRLVRSYPEAAGIPRAECEPPRDWDEVYRAATRLLEMRSFARIFRARYSGLLVDEYQDCNAAQHALIRRMGALRRCVVLGDPLQSVMDFDGGVPDWSGVVEVDFPSAGELDEPWRWRPHRPDLGEWLLDVRRRICARQEIDLAQAHEDGILRWRCSTEHDIRSRLSETCHSLADQEGSAIVVRKHEHQCVASARAYPRFSLLEATELRPVVDLIDELEQSDAPGLILCAWAKRMTVRAPAPLDGVRRHLENGTAPNAAAGWRELHTLFAAVDTDSAEAVLAALVAVRAYRPQSGPSPRILRPGLWFAMESACRHASARGVGLREAVTHVTSRRRTTGRDCPRLAIGRPRLIKGLQFDRVIVLDAEDLDPRELYVSLTRPTRWLGVTSLAPKLQTAA